MKVLSADLHIHTVLSPCAADDMTPPAIVHAARARDLAMIAICDHNAAGNAAATQQAAGAALAVIAGMEITTAEEVHVLGLFADADAATAAADEVRRTLPRARPEDLRRFGPQQISTADGQIVGTEERLLAAATTFSLGAAVELVHRHGGLAIAAHVDRPSFSVMSQLGMIPLDAGFDALEVFGPVEGRARVEEFTQYGLPVLCSSDSHFLADIGQRHSTLRLEAASFDELRLALRGTEGRGVVHA